MGEDVECAAVSVEAGAHEVEEDSFDFREVGHALALAVIVLFSTRWMSLETKLSFFFTLMLYRYRHFC